MTHHISLARPLRTAALAASLLCILTACEQPRDPNLDAAPLLEQARIELREGDFESVRTLLDSLRTTYPRAFDVRRQALAFEDSLRIDEAIAEQMAQQQRLDSAVVAFDEWQASHPDFSFLDPAYQHLRNVVDTLQLEQDRLEKKVGFYLRQAEEHRKAAAEQTDNQPTGDAE